MYSGGHGATIQLGWVALASPPGQPLKVITCSTPSLVASCTVCSKIAWCTLPTEAFGCSGFPWQLRALIVRPRFSMASRKAFSFFSLASNWPGLQ